MLTPSCFITLSIQDRILHKHASDAQKTTVSQSIFDAIIYIALTNIIGDC